MSKLTLLLLRPTGQYNSIGSMLVGVGPLCFRTLLNSPVTVIQGQGGSHYICLHDCEVSHNYGLSEQTSKCFIMGKVFVGESSHQNMICKNVGHTVISQYMAQCSINNNAECLETDQVRIWYPTFFFIYLLT